MKVLQYLWDEGFLKLHIGKDGPRVSLATSIEDVHEAILTRFGKDSADWWKNT